MCLDLDEKIERRNSTRKERLVSCVESHKGTAVPSTHWRLFVYSFLCFSFQYFAKSTEQPLEFQRRSTANTWLLSVCVTVCSSLHKLDVLFWSCWGFLGGALPLVMSQRAHHIVSCCYRAVAPPPGLTSPARPQSFSPLPCLRLFVNTCSKSDNSIKAKPTTSHGGRLTYCCERRDTQPSGYDRW